MTEKRQFFIEYEVYNSTDDLKPDDLKLLQTAQLALEKVHAPYSKFRVGAAVLLQNGEIVSGGNQENAAYSVTICAERVAMSAATSLFPSVPMEAVAVVAKAHQQPLRQPISPCGTCRQFLSEFEQRYQQPIRLILHGEMGVVYVFKSVADILPFYFNSSYLL